MTVPLETILMKRITAILLIVTSLLALSACTLQINIINPNATPAATPATGGTPGPVDSAPTVTSTQPTAAPSITATSTEAPLALPLRLEPGERLSVHTTFMLDSTSGWGIGHGQASAMDHILRTSDGGDTWREVTPPRLLAQPSLVYNVAEAYFTDNQHAWVIYTTQDPSPLNSQTQVWTTKDGGRSWTSTAALDYANLSTEQLMPASVGYSDENHGWVMVHLGGGMSQDYIAIFTTADGGKSWKRVVDPSINNLGMGCTKTGVVFTTPDTGWVVGNCGGAFPGVYFYSTTDGGQNWETVKLPDPTTRPDIFKTAENICGAESISFSSPQAGRMLVRCSLAQENETRAWLYTTRDAGRTWAPYGLPTPYGSYDFINGQIGWWLGAASADPNEPAVSLFFTRDSGLTWSIIISPGWTGTVDFADAQNGWVVARAGDRNALVFTGNGGKTWQQVRPVAAP